MTTSASVENSAKGASSPAMTLGNVDGRANNFDVLRCAMAALVILSHSWFLVGLPDPGIGWSGGASSIGAIAVDVFFIVSGYLVSMSWDRSRTPLGFLGKRISRIYPCYIVVTLLCALVVAPLVMQPGLPRFEPYNLVKMLKSCVTLIRYRAPGAFWSNPVSEDMYGSSWTIEYEARCYVLTLLFGLLLGRRAWGRWVLLVVWLGVLVANVAGLPHWSGGRVADFIFVETYNWPRFLSTYLAGTLAWHFRGKIPISGWLALVCFVATPLLHWPVGYHLVMPTCGAYLVFWFAYQRYLRLHNFARFGDFSYGIYLYAFPIQQVLVYCFRERLSWQLLFLYSTPLAILAGILSWHLVEKHFLSRHRQRATTTPAALEKAS